MKFLDKISEALGLYEEEEELIEESVNEELEEKPKKSFFSRKPARSLLPKPSPSRWRRNRLKLLCWSPYLLTIRRRLPIT